MSLSISHQRRASFAALALLGFLFIKIIPSETYSCVDLPSLVVFAHYGVLERARGCELSVNEEFIYRSATMNYSIPHVHVGVALEVGGEEIDGVKIASQERQNLLRKSSYTALESYTASMLDKEVIEDYCSDKRGICAQPFWSPHYHEQHIQRAFRMMLCEQHLSAMLKRNHVYADAVVLVMSADIIPNMKVDPLDISRAYCNKQTVFFTNNNDGPDGYTDGFYLGHIDSVTKALSLYRQLESIFRSGHHNLYYERLLKLTCEMQGIRGSTLTGFGTPLHDLVKVRASGEIFQRLNCAAKRLIDNDTCPQLAKHSCFQLLVNGTIVW